MVEGDFYDESGYRGTQRLLELDEPPTAIFAASDLMAAGAIRAASDLGVRVPEDVAIVGFDDIGLASLIQPQLTTVRQDMHALGEAAANGLARMIDDPESPPARELVPTTARRAGVIWSKRSAGGTDARDQGGGLAGLAAALTEPPAAGQSSHQRVQRSQGRQKHRMSTYLKTPRRRATTLAAVLVVLGLAAAALAASTASGSRRRHDHAPCRPVRRLRLPRPLQAVREGAPEHRHQGRRSRATPTTTRTSRSTWRSASGADDIESIEVGFIAQFKSQPSMFVNLNKYGAKSAQNQWLDWKWRQSIAPQRRPDRPRHGRRQPRDLLPARPVQEGRPADQPDGRLEALADLAGVRRRPASASRSTRRRASPSSTPAATSSTR